MKVRYDGHNRKAGHAKQLRQLGHRRARRVWCMLLRWTRADRAQAVA